MPLIFRSLTSSESSLVLLSPLIIIVIMADSGAKGNMTFVSLERIARLAARKVITCGAYGPPVPSEGKGDANSSAEA